MWAENLGYITGEGLHVGCRTWGLQTLLFSSVSSSLGLGSAKRPAKLGVSKAAKACRAASQAGVAS